MPWFSWVVSNVLLALLLALAAWFMQRWLRRPAIAHILWVLVLVKLVTPPLVSVPLRESSGNTACQNGACLCGPHSSGVPLPSAGKGVWILLAAWLVGAAGTGWIAWCRWARFRRLMAHARPTPPEWQSLAARLASELSIRQPPEILAVPGRLPPLVIPGRRRPRMLLPMALMHQLNASQRVALLLHELVHIKRGDHLVRMLELAVSVVYWWLPIVSLIGRQLRSCEEACCDAAVVAHLPQARRGYAKLLLDVLDFVNPLPGQAVPQATAMSAGNDLEQRLLAILDAKVTRHTWLVGSFAVGLACVILPCGLRYDFVGRPALAATSAEREPAAGPSRLPSRADECEPPVVKNLCCPS